MRRRNYSPADFEAFYAKWRSERTARRARRGFASIYHDDAPIHRVWVLVVWPDRIDVRQAWYQKSRLDVGFKYKKYGTQLGAIRAAKAIAKTTGQLVMVQNLDGTWRRA